jgi:CcdB protein.
MGQYDVHRSVEGHLLVDIQADILSGLNTRIVVPLMPPGLAPLPARRLNPAFEVEGATMLMVTQYLGAVQVSRLGPAVASLQHHRDRIGLALDMALHGF